MNKGKLGFLGALSFTLSLFSVLVWAEASKQASLIKDDSPALMRVNEKYRRDIRPIFAKKCFDCHSITTHYPWYYSVPGVKQLIDRDIQEARADLDMSKDFPFLGKGTPTDYLDVLKDVINDGSMPPFRYRLLHRGSALTEDEQKSIMNWVNESGIELSRASSW